MGSSNAPTTRVQNHGLVAWDIQNLGGILPHFAHDVELMKLLFKYRPHIVIVLGMLSIFPVAIYSLFSRKSRYIPVFIGEFSYYGRKRIGRFLFNLNLKTFVISLRLSQRKILNMFTLSRYTQEGIQKLARNLTGKIGLISYPIHSEFNDEQERLCPKTLEDPILLTVAGIEPRKGLDTLIKAVSLIPKKFRVIIKGAVRDANYMKRLSNMVNSLDLNKRVAFITDGSDYDSLASYYKSATLFVLPTREDCLGVVILEALHCGIPVIATSVGGIPDMIENGINGILVRPDEPLELAEAISLVLEDEALREKLSANARNSLIRRYYTGRITLEEALIKSIEKSIVRMPV